MLSDNLAKKLLSFIYVLYNIDKFCVTPYNNYELHYNVASEYNYGEFMGKLEDMIDDVNLKINEITAITKCIRDSLECYINNNSDYSHVLPIAKIACQRLDSLTDEYSDLESEIYRKCILQ